MRKKRRFLTDGMLRSSGPSGTILSGNLVPVRRKMIPQQVGKTSKVSKSSLNLVLMLTQDVCARVCVCAATLMCTLLYTGGCVKPGFSQSIRMICGPVNELFPLMWAQASN